MKPRQSRTLPALASFLNFHKADGGRQHKKSGGTCTFYFYYDESGVCTSVAAYQNDPKLSFQSF